MEESKDESGEPGKIGVHSGEALLSGEFACPFDADELGLLEKLLDGYDGFYSNVLEYGLKEKRFKELKESLAQKVKSVYKGEGSDYLAKALSMSVLGGWVKPRDYFDIKREQTSDEFQVLFERSFGKTPAEGILKTGKSPEAFNREFLRVKRDLGLKGDYQVVGWAAAQVKKWVVENPGLAKPVLAQYKLTLAS